MWIKLSYIVSYVVGCEFIFVIFFNSRSKICRKEEQELKCQSLPWKSVYPQMSYLANCHYFSKLPFPLPSWDGPLLNNLKKTMERGGFPHLDACNLDMGYLEAGYQDVHCTLPWCGLTRCTIVDVLYLDVGKRSKDSDTALCSNCKGCVPAIKAFIAKV